MTLSKISKGLSEPGPLNSFTALQFALTSLSPKAIELFTVPVIIFKSDSDIELGMKVILNLTATANFIVIAFV